MHQVLYVSASTDPGNQADRDAILLQSLHNNAIDGLTGLLWVCGARYVQVLEGDAAAIDLTMKRVAADPRHHDINILINRTIDEREFRSWSMAFCHGTETATELSDRVQKIIAFRSASVKACFEEFFV